MRLRSAILRFIENPTSLWDSELTSMLVSTKSDSLKAAGLNNLRDYSTAGALKNDFTIRSEKNVTICGDSERGIVFLEPPSFEHLGCFYDEHGLLPSTSAELTRHRVLTKLKHAMSVLMWIKPAFESVQKLVRAIQVLRQYDPEIDTSYSHPDVPFSIFVSVCADDSTISRLRVAESILHEAMHLKLTLIEEQLALVAPNSKSVFYSPWRAESRPVRGVLHGLFVFRAIYDFFQSSGYLTEDRRITSYISNRLESIRMEFVCISDFYSCPDLTDAGSTLARNLLHRIALGG